MSERQRRVAYQRACNRGADDYRAGKPITANPYKISDWGLGGWWEMGWREAKAENEATK